MSPLSYISYGALGIIIGILAALFGLGGGFLIVPSLHFLGMEMHRAVGTSLATIVFTSLSSTIGYALQKRIHYKVGILLAIPAIVGAYVGAWLTQFLSASELKIFFGLAMIYVSLRLLRKRNEGKKELGSMHMNYPVVLGGGFLAGIISGLLGVGGGIVNVPFLIYLGFPIHYAVATSSFAILFTSLSGATKHYLMGHVDFMYVAFLAPGVIVGAQIGARMAKKLKGPTLTLAFAVVLFILALRIFLKGLGLPVP